MSRRHAVAAAALLVFVVGCKEKTKIKYKTDKATAQSLKTCEESRTLCQKQVTKLRLNDTSKQPPDADADKNEIVLRIEGKTIKVAARTKRSNGGKKPVVGDAQAKDLYKAFQRKVSVSRGAFRKCYTNALKKAPSMQGRVISMNINVRFTSGGQARGVSLSKGDLGASFSNCMNAVVKKWKLPAAPSSYKFQAPITLTPQ